MKERLLGCRLTSWLAASLVAFGLCGGAVRAQNATDVDIRIDCGGIGEDEVSRMRSEAGSHSLMIQFISFDGSFLADVHARIDDLLRDLRAEAECGPIGLVDVPVAGRYRITATYGGHAQEHWLDLKPRGGAYKVLRWLE